mmetsp:Transcript_11713/g.28445  ORF Transcript_11713/g.28445 Transcript_11713/m.28445 type:complete len:293 (-) Transcript_11713:2153-3031(-)
MLRRRWRSRARPSGPPYNTASVEPPYEAWLVPPPFFDLSPPSSLATICCKPASCTMDVWFICIFSIFFVISVRVVARWFVDSRTEVSSLRHWFWISDKASCRPVETSFSVSMQPNSNRLSPPSNSSSLENTFSCKTVISWNAASLLFRYEGTENLLMTSIALFVDRMCTRISSSSSSLCICTRLITPFLSKSSNSAFSFCISAVCPIVSTFVCTKLRIWSRFTSHAFCSTSGSAATSMNCSFNEPRSSSSSSPPINTSPFSLAAYEIKKHHVTLSCAKLFLPWCLALYVTSV